MWVMPENAVMWRAAAVGGYDRKNNKSICFDFVHKIILVYNVFGVAHVAEMTHKHGYSEIKLKLINLLAIKNTFEI